MPVKDELVPYKIRGRRKGSKTSEARLETFRRSYVKHREERRVYSQQYRAKNRVKINAQIREKRQVRRDQWEDFLNVLWGSCDMCGVKDFRVRCFHHLRDKEFDLTTDNCSIIDDEVKIRAEVAKCLPLCFNCHAIYHHVLKETAGRGMKID